MSLNKNDWISIRWGVPIGVLFGLAWIAVTPAAPDTGGDSAPAGPVVVIDPTATAPHPVAVFQDGRATIGTVYPVPTDAAATDAVPAVAAAPSSPLGRTAQHLLYNYMDMHQAIARGVRSGEIDTDDAAGKLAIQWRNRVGNLYGDLLNDRIAKSKSLDESGRIIDPDAYAKIHEDMAKCMKAVLRARPHYLEAPK